MLFLVTSWIDYLTLQVALDGIDVACCPGSRRRHMGVRLSEEATLTATQHGSRVEFVLAIAAPPAS